VPSWVYLRTNYNENSGKHSLFLYDAASHCYCRLEALVHQRISNFQYLRKVHEGGNFWLNIVLLTLSDIQQLVAVVPKQRTVTFYYLGLSIFNLLDVKSGIATVRAFSQLLEEFEYYTSGTAMQGMKMLMAKNSVCVYPSLVVGGGDSTPVSAEESSAAVTATSIPKPGLSKFQNVVIYERLRTPPLAMELDYVEVLVALCEALSKIYDRLFAAECYQ
jgi:hypothetical protein